MIVDEGAAIEIWSSLSNCLIYDPIKQQHLASGQLKKKAYDLDEVTTCARDMVSRDTGQRIPCFDRCQLTITWTLNIKLNDLVDY